MERETAVYVDLAGAAVPVGTLWTRTRGARQTASFEYAASWLARPGAFGIDPALPPARGPFHTDRPLFNAFTDPAPDRWGQNLLRRNERRQAGVERRQPRTLQAIDYLTLVDDRTRLGALRFRDAGAEGSGAGFLTTGDRPVPPVVDLPRLLSATTRAIDEEETDEDLRLILAPGTSLGGARPKATVRDTDGHLLIAKFPRRDDEWPVTRWEAAVMDLARAAGIDVAPFRLRRAADRAVLTARRFDRRQDRRIAFTSALTALEASDHDDQRSYLEIAEFLRREGSAVDRDLRQLWRRIAFNVLVSNTDDHLRNHGFLRAAHGWRLSPAFDVNPVPVDVKPRVHALALDDFDGAASLDTVLAVAPRFGMTGRDARAALAEVGRAVSGWRDAAARHGLTPADVERMASAFDHRDARIAAAGP